MEQIEIANQIAQLTAVVSALSARVSGHTVSETSDEVHDAEGRTYCVIRSRDQGVISGFVDVEAVRALLAAGQQVQGMTVHQARQLWRWHAEFVLMELSETGIKDASRCKFSAAKTMPFEIFGQCGLYTCTQKAAQSIIAQPAEQP